MGGFSEVAPHVVVPAAACLLVWAEAALWAWGVLALAAGLRYALRRAGVSDTAAALTASGLQLLPADDNKVVEDFLTTAQPSDVEAMLAMSTLPGEAVTLFNLQQAPFKHLTGAKGVIRGQHGTATDAIPRIIVQVEGDDTLKLFVRQNLKQAHRVCGRVFEFSYY